jgi:phosphoribosylformimino-5-aminoimidazole carboxamide ribotide isomerase
VAVDGDAVALARIYIDKLGVDALYVADLDAIAGCPPQYDQLSAIAAAKAPVWLDAGVTTVPAARAAIACGAARVIVGLETLRSFTDLAAIAAAIGRNRVAFSLDLRDGRPLLAPGASPCGEHVVDITVQAVAAGAGTVIVLDVARVGMGTGLDFELLRAVRHAAPHVTLVAGGGVRGDADLSMLGAAGCDAALVATALQDGRITPRHRVSR